MEIRRIKKENPNVNIKLDDDVGLIFFTELYDKQSISVSADFNNSLREYTQSAVSRLKSLGGSWTSDHELMLNTVLEERFAMANLVKQANLEIEKVRSISDKRAQALKEKENQFAQVTKHLQLTHDGLKDLFANNASFKDNSVVVRLFEDLRSYVSTDYAVRLEEPYKILGDFVGSGNDFNRVSSILRERELEIDLLRTRFVDLEKKSVRGDYGNVDNERTIQSLRAENASLAKELDRLKANLSNISSGNSGKEKELEMKLKTANSRIQELESQLRTADIQLKQLKDTKSSAASSSY